MWADMIPDLRRRLIEVQGKEKYHDVDLLKRLYDCVSNLDAVIGVSRSVVLRYAFLPYDPDDLTVIDTDLYENVVNISMGYDMYLTNTAAIGSLETKSLALRDKQVGLLQCFWTISGTVGNPPTLDISLDKDPERGEELRGSFLVADNFVDSIDIGKAIDTSMIVSRTFSVKWKFPSGSNYKVRDTVIRILLIDTAKMYQARETICDLTAGAILSEEAIEAHKSGQSTSYVELLTVLADKYTNRGQGISGAVKAPSTHVGALGHQYDRDSYADKAFGKSAGGNAWRPVDIKGNILIGKTVRFID
jgi:hypothetical protein